MHETRSFLIKGKITIELAWTGVLQLEVLIRKLGAVDRLAAGAIVVGEVPALEKYWKQTCEPVIWNTITEYLCRPFYWEWFVQRELRLLNKYARN